MRDRDLVRLGFEDIKGFLKELSTLQLTAELIDRLMPSTDPEEVRESIKALEEFATISPEIMIPPLKDIRESLKRSRIQGAHLNVEELLNILAVIESVKELRRVIGEHARDLETLQRVLKRLHNFSSLENLILASVDRRGFVRDSASERLREIRTKIRKLEEEISRRLESLLNRSDADKIFSDRIVTLRNNRYVVPVRTSSFKSVFGIVHGKSSSGFTTYVEPQFVVGLNNELSRLKELEEEEVLRVLRSITEVVGEFGDRLQESYEQIAILDLMKAKVELGEMYGGRFPEIGEHIELREVSHPLLHLIGDGTKEVVPIDIIMKERKGLILTGPNTGGKTVALKTLGLVALMFQSGVPVPVGEGSVMPLFEKVFVDIGDEQSIEQSLSTFSSHIKNISEFLTRSDEKTLVILDELGAGTDPVEGSAIGIGILEFLRKRGAWVVVSTHHMPIKVYSLSSDYYRPASVVFDTSTLQPRYKISYDSVGESMAFEVASRLGVPGEVLEEALSHLGEFEREYSKATKKLGEITRSYQERLEELDRLQQKLREEIGRYEKLREELEREKERGWREAYREAKRYLQSLYAEGEKLLSGLRDREDLRRFLDEKSRTIKEHRSDVRDVPSPGDRVVFEGGRGRVLRVEGDKVWVVSGGVRLEIDLDMIERVEGKEKADLQESVQEVRRTSMPSEINLLGKDRDTALLELERFIEEAWAGGLKVVRIAHGIGKGVLRKAVQEYLSSCDKVKFFRTAYPGEGGSGVTVAYLNQEG